MTVGRRGRRFIGYPTDSLIAVLPDPESAAAAAAALRAAGIQDRDITILRGPEGADRLDVRGAVNGVIARLRRLVSFTLMDQLVDMAIYEQAVRDGQVVVMARGPRPAQGRDRRRPAPARPSLHQLLRTLRDRGDRALARPRAPGRRPAAALTLAPAGPQVPSTVSSTNSGMTRFVLRW